MARQWSVFFGLVLVVVLAAEGSASPTPAPSPTTTEISGPRCSIELDGTKTEARVGDELSYHLGGCAAGLELKASPDLYEYGIAARPGRILVILKDGSLSVPELDVVDPKTGAVVAKTDPVTVQAKTVIEGQGEEAMKPQPAIGYLGLGLPTWIQTLIAFVILGLFAIIAFLILRWTKNKAKRFVRAVMPKKPYDIQAIEKLQKIFDAGHLRKSEWKKFAFGVSETLKFYLGNRYGFDAQESTTSELFDHLDRLRVQAGPSEAITARLKSIFEQLDLVKFTHHVPTVDSMLSLWKESKQIIETTRVYKVEPLSKEPIVMKKTGGTQI